MAWVSLAEYRALGEVRYRIRRFLNFSEARARSVGLEPQQHQLLLALRGLPESARPTIRQLSERLQIQHNSAVELVRRSVQKGLVVKRPSAQDGREILLELTERGRELLEQLAVAHRAELRKAAPKLVAALSMLVPSEEVAP
jgi:DNA-binding MarR family transcriptional regulator